MSWAQKHPLHSSLEINFFVKQSIIVFNKLYISLSRRRRGVTEAFALLFILRAAPPFSFPELDVYLPWVQRGDSQNFSCCAKSNSSPSLFLYPLCKADFRNRLKLNAIVVPDLSLWPKQFLSTLRNGNGNFCLFTNASNEVGSRDDTSALYKKPSLSNVKHRWIRSRMRTDRRGLYYKKKHLFEETKREENPDIGHPFD